MRSTSTIEAAIFNRVLDRDWTLNRGALNASHGLRTVRPCEAFKTSFSAVGPFNGALSRFIPISALGLGVHVSRRKSSACPWNIPLSPCKVGYLVHPSSSVSGGGLEWVSGILWKMAVLHPKTPRSVGFERKFGGFERKFLGLGAGGFWTKKRGFWTKIMDPVFSIFSVFSAAGEKRESLTLGQGPEEWACLPTRFVTVFVKNSQSGQRNGQSGKRAFEARIAKGKYSYRMSIVIPFPGITIHFLLFMDAPSDDFLGPEKPN